MAPTLHAIKSEKINLGLDTLESQNDFEDLKDEDDSLDSSPASFELEELEQDAAAAPAKDSNFLAAGALISAGAAALLLGIHVFRKHILGRGSKPGMCFVWKAKRPQKLQPNSLTMAVSEK